MALLRKDLKLGFLAGGTILVLGVGYVLVGSFFGSDNEPVTDPLAFDPETVLTEPGDSAPPAEAASSAPVNNAATNSASDWGDFGQPTLTQTPTGSQIASSTLPPDAPVEPVTPNLNETGDVAGGTVLDSIVSGTRNNAVSADSAPAGQPAASTPASTTPPAATGAGRTHEVASGENLSSIAEKYYGDPNLFSIIQDANPSVDSRRLRVGQVLQIPDRAAALANKPATSAASGSQEAPAADDPTVHVVRSGETLSSIASKRFGRAALWQDIYDLNRDLIGADPAALKVGMKLKLPK